MSSTTLHTSLLRPPILHILRAAGFHATKPHVLDTLVDLAARYLSMLALNATAHAQENHNDPIPTITDVRMALEDVGAFQPQVSAMEERITGKQDGSGVDAFLRWMKGEENREIRRIAGLVETDGLMLGIDMPTDKEDFLTGTSHYFIFRASSIDVARCSFEEKTQQDWRKFQVSRHCPW
ncbi:MAG: hypothetical protein LQ344_005834 [Seirophora lacunosa]|nr:MAG: hypothetical protein LQ344_005834 [Seirophora lacunosa]